MKRGPKSKPFEAFLSAPNEHGCVEWTGVTIKSNRSENHRYGRLTRDGKKYLAHRIAWERVRGPIPPGREVCHLCDNGLCCNLDHLFLGTHRENMLDAAQKGRMARISRPGLKGELSPKAKLSDKQIIDLRARRAAGETVTALAAVYGVHHSYISRLARGIRR